MTFDLAAFLATAGVGRRIVQLNPKQAFFSQGSSADSIFYLQTGRAKLTVVSQDGKEATIALLAAREPSPSQATVSDTTASKENC
jgi:CRP-like cAMP-binding protein